MMVTGGSRAIISDLPDGGVRIMISKHNCPLSVQTVLTAMQTEPEAAAWFGACLAALPWRAFFWECPALTVATLSDPFECVALEASSLLRQVAAPEAFREHLETATPGSLVAVFRNLGGDAVLVVPTDVDHRRAYPHLGAFLRAAPSEQIAAFFSAVAREGLRLCSEGPVWLSTAGSGVAWLHGRVDSWPKYYHHVPYRAGHRVSLGRRD